MVEKVKKKTILSLDPLILIRWLKTMFMLVEPAGMINASVNFVIYCLAGTRYRVLKNVSSVLSISRRCLGRTGADGKSNR